MNTQVAERIEPQADQWDFWTSALRGEKPETTPGTPHSGFFRDGNKRAVAIWNQDGTWFCTVTAGYCPRHLDEIDELFGFVCRKPISRETYMAHAEGKGWPETVPAAGRVVEKTDNNPPEELSPDRALAAEIAALETQCFEWLMTLPGADAEKGTAGSPSNKTEADLAANYGEKFLKLEQRAIEAHKKEKEPHLKAGKECDARWFAPCRDIAVKLKVQIQCIAKAWAAAEDKRKAEEVHKANEEAKRIADEANRKAREQADRVGAAPPPEVKPVEVVAERTKVGTGRAISNRATGPTYLIEDLPKVATFFASVENPSHDLREILQKLTNFACKAGVDVPGVKTVKE